MQCVLEGRFAEYTVCHLPGQSQMNAHDFGLVLVCALDVLMPAVHSPRESLGFKILTSMMRMAACMNIILCEMKRSNWAIVINRNKCMTHCDLRCCLPCYLPNTQQAAHGPWVDLANIPSTRH